MAKQREIKFKVSSKGCHEVTSHKSGTHGYPVTKRIFNGVKYHILSRFIYAQKFGIHPKQLCVCHTCDNRICINPEHLFLGTRAENCVDRDKKGRTSKIPRTNGSVNGMSKLKDKDIIKIRFLRGKKTQSEIAKQFNISQSHVAGIQLKRFWYHLGGM